MRILPWRQTPLASAICSHPRGSFPAHLPFGESNLIFREHSPLCAPAPPAPLPAQRSVAKAHGLGYSRDVRRCRVLEGSIRSFEIHGQTTGIASRAACGALIPLHRPISARSPVTRPARCRSGTFAGKAADAFPSPSRRAARQQHGGARPEESHPESQERPSSIRRAHHVLGRRPVELRNAPPARSLLSRSR